MGECGKNHSVIFKEIVEELISWWMKLQKNKNIQLPIIEKTGERIIVFILDKDLENKFIKS